MQFILGLLLGSIASVFFYIKYKSLQKKEIQTTRKLKDLEAKAQPLWKYQKIVDLEEKVLELKKEARDKIDKTEAFIKQKKADTELEINRIKTDSENIVQNAKVESEQIIANARQEYEATILKAKQEAKIIAKDALEAKEKSLLYESTVRAMKNVIEGYGDEYLIPNRSVLDDLADHFEHKQVGEELKKARSESKKMIKDGLAASCDYVEKNRRETAIHFVLDAYNGKVESILSKAKYNNYGKLKQEIDDAFALVNFNAEAFRNAKITPEYHGIKLHELKWAVSANELLLQEREEQKRINELIREEEKAKREYEKAIKEAEKEEDLLKKAMEQARKQLEAAGMAEKAGYEAKIKDLEEKYKLAEEKNQRAISMAQQTKRGHVYIISNVGSFGEDVFKIGLTRRLEPLERVKELGDASVPFDFDVHALFFTEDAPALETNLHNKFNDKRVNKINLRKEFFNLKISEIKNAIEGMDIQTHWTMLAEAKEYKETLALNNKQ